MKIKLVVSSSGGICFPNGRPLGHQDIARWAWAGDDEIALELDPQGVQLLKALGLPVEPLLPEVVVAANAIIARRRRAERRRASERRG